MSAHTPTPWDIDENDGAIYSLVFPGAPVVAFDVLPTNAAHIVRCVNERDALVAALRLALDDLIGSKTEQVIRAALAKVSE